MLYLFSLVYGMVVRLLVSFWRAKPYKASVKVIGVGNITVGGTGKTSAVIYIAHYLRRQGRKVAVVTRGYKRGTGIGARDSGFPSPKPGTRNPIPGTSPLPVTRHPSPESMGDEPFMLACVLKDIPVVVDANRIRGIEKARKEYGVDTVILDDSFQQWKIKKDLEIVAIDAGNPFGNGFLLPRGVLREPRCALLRADMLLLTKTDGSPGLEELKRTLRDINPHAELFESVHQVLGFYEWGDSQTRIESDYFKKGPVLLFSGIGDPGSFEKKVRQEEITIEAHLRYPDHYRYRAEDLAGIISTAEGKNIDAILTTEKDAARLSGTQKIAGRARIFVCAVRLAIVNDEERFLFRLSGLYSH